MTLSIIYSYKIRTETSRSWHSLGFVTIPFTADILHSNISTVWLLLSAVSWTMQRNPPARHIYFVKSLFIFCLLKLSPCFLGFCWTIQKIWLASIKSKSRYKSLVFLYAGQGWLQAQGQGNTMIQITQQQGIWVGTPASLVTPILDPSRAEWHLYWQRVGPLCWYKDKRQPLTPLTANFLSPAEVCLVFELVISGIFNELVKITPPSSFVICILLWKYCQNSSP